MAAALPACPSAGPFSTALRMLGNRTRDHFKQTYPAQEHKSSQGNYCQIPMLTPAGDPHLREAAHLSSQKLENLIFLPCVHPVARTTLKAEDI